jgi:branched-chain amino acid transport system permease protein
MNKNIQSDIKSVDTTIKARNWVKPATWLGVVVFAALVPLVIKSPYYLHILILVFIYMIAAVSLRTILVSGQWNMAQGAFMGIGAYAGGMASRWLDWPAWINIPLGGLVAMAIGIIIGYPFARLRSLYYALGSLFFGIGVTQIISALYVTGGYSGLTGIHPIFASDSKVVYYYFFLGFALICILLLYRFEFSRIGINIKAIAQSHDVASSVGINEAWYRVMVVGVGCFFVGLAGAAYAQYTLVISPNVFNYNATLWIVMYMLIGGIQSIAGPIIGSVIGVMVPQLARNLQMYTPFVFAGILIIILYTIPKGLVSIPHVINSRLKGLKKDRMVNVT